MSESPQIFERDYYQRLHDIEEHHGWARGVRAVMTELFRGRFTSHPPLRVLDVGCGTGFLLGDLEQYPLQGPVVGTDYSEHALRFCQGRGASQLALADAVRQPFAAASFDLVICIDTLQHLSPAGADAAALAEFTRLLRPGGWLYARTNSALGHVPLTGVDPNLYRRYRREELANLITIVGLHVERATYVNGLPGFWAMLREYRADTREAAAIGPSLTIRPVNPLMDRLVYAVLRAEAWMIGRGIDLPFGHSLAVLARK